MRPGWSAILGFVVDPPDGEPKIIVVNKKALDPMASIFLDQRRGSVVSGIGHGKAKDTPALPCWQHPKTYALYAANKVSQASVAHVHQLMIVNRRRPKRFSKSGAQLLGWYKTPTYEGVRQ